MSSLTFRRPGAAALAVALTLAGCRSPAEPPATIPGCDAIDFATPAPGPTPPPGVSSAMTVLGLGTEAARYTAEVAVRGDIAYTTTWGTRGGNRGNKINIWNVAGAEPVLLDSVIVSGQVTTLGDVSIADDGSIMIVPTEFAGSLLVYDLTDPARPVQVSRYATPETAPGVHTAKLARVNGTLYAFLAVNLAGLQPSRLLILRLSNPAAPVLVFSRAISATPNLHDTFVRDGLLFVAAWNNGVELWDLGGCGPTHGASPEQPRHFATVRTVGGSVHNVWWLHDPVSGSRRYLLVGEESGGTIGVSSSGDIHVVDMANLDDLREVAFYTVPGAGTHNFSVDEANGILYAAYYNGGVRAIDVRGELGSCDPAHRVAAAGTTRCDMRAAGRELAVGLLGGAPVFVWGVQFLDGAVYASDMLNGLWKISAVNR